MTRRVWLDPLLVNSSQIPGKCQGLFHWTWWHWMESHHKQCLEKRRYGHIYCKVVSGSRESWRVLDQLLEDVSYQPVHHHHLFCDYDQKWPDSIGQSYPLTLSASFGQVWPQPWPGGTSWPALVWPCSTGDKYGCVRNYSTCPLVGQWKL